MNASPVNLDWSSVPAEKRAAIELIWNWDLEFLRVRLMDKRMMPEGITKLAIMDYRRFMTLAVLDDDLEMLSDEVDEVWHAHILFTHQYAEFCQAIYGKFMHHEPRLSSDPPNDQASDARDKFLRAHRALFGEPSVLWSS